MKLELDVNAIGNGHIILDGHDVSGAVRRLDFSAGVGEVTRLVLEMHILENTRLTGEVIVVVPERTARVLTQLGWTPPRSQAVAG